MSEIISENYLYIKTLHIIAMICWMAGLLYLPRLFVYHAESVKKGSETDKLFQKMEYRLLKFIMNPAMIITWICGILLLLIPGLISHDSIWFVIKFLAIFSLTGYHMWLGKLRKGFVAGKNAKTARFYRLINEIPTVLMILILIMVIVRPF